MQKNQTMTRLSLFLTILFFSVQTLSAQVYVDANATGANHGGSWADAFTSLKFALDVIPQNADVWVKEGTYTPDAGTGDRNARFQLKSGQKVLGGFPSNIANPTYADRDVDAYETILSGEIGAAGNADNSIHVVVISDVYDVILDGLTIQDGNANDNSFWLGHQGGGLVVIYWDSGNTPPTPAKIENCTLKNNEATWGGGGAYLRAINNGVALSTIETEFNSCIFENNISDNIGGGLMLDVRYANSPLLGNASFTDCQFINNVATNNGGGCEISAIVGGSDNSTFTDCTFSQNKVVNYTGAGMRLDGYDGTIATTLTGCVFSNNGEPNLDEQWHGGGISLNASSNGLVTADISNCTFTDNYCKWDGGGIYLDGSDGGNCSPTINDCDFTDNTTQSGGGAGIFMRADGIGGEASPNISDCNFTGGSTYNGGGITLWADANGNSTMHPVIDNCDFISNAASNGGGMMISGWNGTDVKPTISNCDFIGNTAIYDGGGVANYGNNKSAGAASFEPLFVSCKFNENVGGNSGGAYNTGDNNGTNGICKPRYERCLFWNNDVTNNYTGAIKAGKSVYNNADNGYIESEFENCIFYEDDYNTEGILILNRAISGTDNSTFIHCTAQNNSGEILYQDNSDVFFYYCALRTLGSTPVAITVPSEGIDGYSAYGVITGAPLTGSTNIPGYFDISWYSAGTYYHNCTSDLIDHVTAQPVSSPTVDYHGNPRNIGAFDSPSMMYPDAGAIEFGGSIGSIGGSITGVTQNANLRLDYPDGWSYLMRCSGGNLSPILGIKDLEAAAFPGQNGFNVSTYIKSGTIVDLSNADYVTNPDGFEVFERNWDVESPYSVPTGGQSVRFFYSPGDLTNIQNHLGVSNAEDLVFFKVSGAGIAPYDECVLNCGGTYNEYTFASNGVATTDKYIYGNFNSTLLPYAEYKVTSFSGGGGGGAPGGGGALPLELQSLKGIKLPKNNKIQWSTIMEEDVQYHILERSKNGIDDWTEIGREASKGNSESTQNYEIFDNQPFPLTYYRLRFVDISGDEQLSEMISIKREGDISWEIAPNPAKDFFNIKISSAKETDIQIRITDVLGRVVWQEVKSLTTTDSEIRLENLDWEKGIYFVTMEVSGETQIRKLILE